jgi:eukaryotic-like serine/threonine-protein kinase
MPDYDRLQRLGAGAFGEVWLVFDKALGVCRAVKYVRPARIHDPTDFYREPKTLMELRHPNIVRVEDAGTLPDGTLYIAMEHLRRGSVEQRFKGRPVPLSRALKLLCDVCWGLEYAHQRHYVHRDIKPANILLGPKGEGKLSDFGLATRALAGSTASPYGYLTHLAPEVFTGSITTHLTDVYAVGVTAYRLINGDSFLPAPADLGDLQDMIEGGTYPDRTYYRPYVPVAIKRVINRAMNSDPDSRFQSAAELRQNLERIAIMCDWKWKQKRDKVRYRAVIGPAVIETTVTQNGRRFDIETTKQNSSGSPRRVTKDCAKDLTLTQMKTRLRKILPRYVSEGK